MVILLFGLKGCVIGIWKSPDTPKTYAIHGSDGRSLVAVFLPKNETIWAYTDDAKDSMEVALIKMRGTYGTHYFWRFWNVDGADAGGGFFGYRIFPKNTKPVVMEMTVLKKFIHGTSRPTLRGEGSRTHPVVVFAENAIEFEGMWLEEEPTSPELVKVLLNKLK